MIATVLAAVPTVNTAINWPGLAISLGTFIASMAAVLAYIDHRAERRQATVRGEQVTMRTEFREALENMGALLSERLETKENVNNLRVEVARLSEQLRIYAERNRDHAG